MPGVGDAVAPVQPAGQRGQRQGAEHRQGAASSGETLRHLALSGAGIACLSNFLTRDDLAAGTLVPALAPRVAALVDFLARRLGQGILDA